MLFVRRVLFVIIPAFFLLGLTPLPDPAIALLILPGVGSCTVFYVEPAYELRLGASIVASAGHCAFLGPARVNEEEVEWLQAVRDGVGTDFAIGLVTDNRPTKTYHGFAKERAKVGEVVYIEGFPFGERNSAYGTVVETESTFEVPLAMEVLLDTPTLGPGASGSPVMMNGEVVGILWGSHRFDPFRIVFTPITQ